jgi:site-specific DNA-methyltransferase (adenine-specific)
VPGSRRSVAIGDGRLFHGDCAAVLPRLIDGPRFDLVYLDPPFNAGGKRGARGERGARVNGEFAYKDEWGGLDAFLAMLEPRLGLLSTLLSPRGSLWLHLDHRAVHDAKVVADGVFGRSSFRGEIVWIPGNGARKRSGPSVTHQTILVYSRAPEMIWNADDPALREPYAETSSRMHFTRKDAKGRVFRERVINGKSYRYYADQGRMLGSVWSDCPAMRANTPLIRETTGYPTQKPLKLLERIVAAATLKNSHVLDPMCGSGTTLVAAAKLGRRWVGIDQSPVGFATAQKRLRSLE